MATVAARVTVEPVVVDAAGALDMATTIGAVVTMFAVDVANMAELVVDFAVIVAVPPVGTEMGAIYVVTAPLAVCAGLTVPQLVAQQLTLQSTPALAESLPTRAETAALWAVPEVCTYSTEGATLTVTGTGADGFTICTVALADLLVSVSDVTVIVTVPPGGIADGAVYADVVVRSVTT